MVRLDGEPHTGTGVLVGVGVGQVPPGHGVDVAVGVSVGPLVKVAEPLYATAAIDAPLGSERDGSRKSADVPRAPDTGLNWIVASVPLPLGPGGVGPIVPQP